MDPLLIAEICVIATLIAAVLGWFVWRSLRRRGRDSWPMATATIETGHIEIQQKIHGHHGNPLLALVLGYSFSVSGSYFSGDTAIAATDYGDADWLVPKLAGKTLTIRYDPKRPDNSFAFDSRIGEYPLLTKNDVTGYWNT